MGIDNKKIFGHLAKLLVPGIAVIASVIMIYLGVLSHYRFTSTSVKLYQQTQLTIASSAAQGVDSLLQNLENQLEILSMSSAVQNPLSVECRVILKQFYFSNQTYVYAGYRMSQDKRLVQMFPPDPKSLGQDISSQDHVKEMYRTGKKVVSGRFRALEGFDAVTIHYPVYRNQELSGSVATLVRLSSISETFIKPIKEHSVKGYGWMVDDQGVIVSHPDADLVGKPLRDVTSLGGKNPAAAAAALNSSISQGAKGSGRYGEMLVAHVPVMMGGRTWTVLVSTPFAAIAAPIERNLFNTIGFMGLILILLGGAAYWLLQTNMRAAGLEKNQRHLQEKLSLQEQLRANRDHLETIIRTMPSGLFTIDRDQTILTWNETAEEITGFTALEVIGRKCSVFHTEPCNNRCGLWDPATPKPITGAECTFRHKEGKIITISKNVDYMLDAQGRINGGIESFIDITEARKVEEARINALTLEKEIKQLRRMDEIKTNFLSMVSHELRTPLSVILGNLTLALRGRFGQLPDPLDARLQTIQKRAQQLNHLIENLLNLTRLETGKLDIHKQPLDLRSVINDTLLTLNNDILDKSITLDQQYDPPEPAVFADRGMIQQVFTNILGNAIKFTPDQGTIAISTKPLPGALEIHVRDTGVGIPENALPKVFDRFFQADNSPTRAFGGTGLGLAIVKEIIDMHKGAIRIQSRECEFTEVIFTLPIHRGIQNSEQEPPDQQTDPDPNPEPEPRANPGAPSKILIVDDDMDFLNLICDMFHATRFHIISTDSTIHGLEILKDEKPDVILLDLMMAGKDGYFFLKIVRADETTHHIPVIILSASIDKKHQKKAADLGAAAYITKPVNQKELFDTIEKLLA
jgi:PAS domain S-box-containing protein